MAYSSDEVREKEEIDFPQDQEGGISRESRSSIAESRCKENSQERFSKKGRTILYVILVLVGIGIVLYFIFPPSVNSCEVEPKETVEEYSWEELSCISRLISTAPDDIYINNILQKYNLVTPEGTLDGTQVKDVKLANGKVIQVQIAGFNHDVKSDGTGDAGITFIFKDAIDMRPMNQSDTNIGGWANSEMRRWLSSDCINELPQDLRNVLVEVEKLTDNKGSYSDNESPVNVGATSDLLWLYSPVELFGEVEWYSESIPYVDDIYNAEGTQYELFRDLDTTSKSANEILIKNFDEEAVYWWGRSPNVGIQGFFFDISQNGAPTNGNIADNTYGVVPGFCIESKR